MIAEIEAKYLDQPLSSEVVEEIITKINTYYSEEGFDTSGAYLPPNHFDKEGVLTLQVLEGTIGKFDIQGNNQLSNSFIESRLRTSQPLKSTDLLRSLEELRRSPWIDSVNAKLVPGVIPGQNDILLEVVESNPFSLRAAFDNTSSPVSGSFRRGVEASYTSALFSGDEFAASYFNSEGSDVVEAGYNFPINSQDGRIGFEFAFSDADVVEEPFIPLNIEFNATQYKFFYKQPVSRRVSLGLEFSHDSAESFLLGERFALAPGANEVGETKVSKLTFVQEYVDRSDVSFFGFSSRFLLGVDLFGSTINGSGIPDSSYFAWQGDFAYARAIANNTLFTTIGKFNLTPDLLLPIEQLSLGGVNSVRGYRRDLVRGDNGFSLSSEVRLPLYGNSSRNLIQVIPFFDLGYAWSNESRSQGDFLAGLGLGFSVNFGGLAARLDYGIPLVDAGNSGDSLQDEGLYFSLSSSF